MQQPRLVVYETAEQSVNTSNIADNYNMLSMRIAGFFLQELPCINTATEIQCTMPRLDDLLTTTVFYTVIVDNAEGPDSTRAALRIELQPNPEFLEDGSALENNEYQPGSEAIIQIVVIPL